MSEMVERVARAMYVSFKGLPQSVYSWEDLTQNAGDPLVQSYRRMARAAVEAMQNGAPSTFRRLLRARGIATAPCSTATLKTGQRVLRVSLNKYAEPQISPYSKATARALQVVEKEMKKAGYPCKVSVSAGGGSVRCMIDEALK